MRIVRILPIILILVVAAFFGYQAYRLDQSHQHALRSQLQIMARHAANSADALRVLEQEHHSTDHYERYRALFSFRAFIDSFHSLAKTTPPAATDTVDYLPPMSETGLLDLLVNHHYDQKVFADYSQIMFAAEQQISELAKQQRIHHTDIADLLAQLDKTIRSQSVFQ